MKTFEEVMQLTRTISHETAFSEVECKAYYDLLVALPQGSTVCEIGLQFGRSSSIVAQLQKDKGFIYLGIDPFIEPPEAGPKWLEMMLSTGANFTLEKMRSDEVIPFGANFLLIDGSHAYDDVKHDFIEFATNFDSIVCVHDYGRESLPDVKRAVDDAIENCVYGNDINFKRIGIYDTLAVWRVL